MSLSGLHAGPDLVEQTQNHLVVEVGGGTWNQFDSKVVWVRISPSRTPYLILGIEIPDWDLKELHMSYSVPKLIQVE